jgi:hypothetical protein
MLENYLDIWYWAVFFLSFCPSESYSSNGLVNPISCGEHCRNSQRHIGGWVGVGVVGGEDPNQVTEPYFAYQKMSLIWQMMTYFGLARIRADIYYDAVPTLIWNTPSVHEFMSFQTGELKWKRTTNRCLNVIILNMEGVEGLQYFICPEVADCNG